MFIGLDNAQVLEMYIITRLTLNVYIEHSCFSLIKKV